MDETFKCFLPLIVPLLVFEDVNVTSADDSSLSKNYLSCLVSAGNFFASLETSFCNGPISDPLDPVQELCTEICTMHTTNISCQNNSIKALFQYDINLPKNTYFFGSCSTCFNVTQINITCGLNVTNNKIEPTSTKNEEGVTVDTISKSSGINRPSVTTALLTSTSTIQLNKTDSIQSEEEGNQITASKADQNIQVAVIVAAAVSGVVFGALLTIGVWIIKQKLSRDKLWQRRSTVKNPTYIASPRSSDPEPEPDVSMDNQYKEVIPKNKRSYTPKEDSDPYNHLHEITNNMEDISSPYDHAPYLPQDGRKQNETIQDSGYMHIDINKLGMN